MILKVYISFLFWMNMGSCQDAEVLEKLSLRNNIARLTENECKSRFFGSCTLFSQCTPATDMYAENATQIVRLIEHMICRIDNEQHKVFVCCGAKLHLPRECGRSLRGRIIKGQKTNHGDWPWLASLGTFRQSLFINTCGGTLITRRHVITAQHCESELLTDALLGDHNISDPSDNRHTISAKIIKIINPGYDPNSRVNDIALLYLDRRIPLGGDFIKAACLPFNYKMNNFLGHHLQIVGRGSTDINDNSAISSIPLEGDVVIVATDNCRFDDAVVLDDRVLCAQSEDSYPYKGDSGGPLNFSEENINYVVGVISYGLCSNFHCSSYVFTRVSEYLNWIMSNL